MVSITNDLAIDLKAFLYSKKAGRKCRELLFRLEKEVYLKEFEVFGRVLKVWKSEEF